MAQKRIRSHSRRSFATVVAIFIITMAGISPGKEKSTGTLAQDFGWSPKMAPYTLNGVKFKYPMDFQLQQLSGVEADAVAMIDKSQDWGIFQRGIFVAAPNSAFNRDEMVERVRAATVNVLLPKESKEFSWTGVEVHYVASAGGGHSNRSPQEAHKLSRYDTYQRMYQGYNKNVLVGFEVHQLKLAQRVILVGHFFVGAGGDEAKEAVQQDSKFAAAFNIESLMACALTISTITGEKPTPVGFVGGVPGGVPK